MASSGGTGSVHANSINSEVLLRILMMDALVQLFEPDTGVRCTSQRLTQLPWANISSNISMDPLYISKADNFHTINIYRATSFQEGVSRFADVTNSADKTKNNLYVSPAYLNTEVAELESKIADLQAQIDILKSYHP